MPKPEPGLWVTDEQMMRMFGVDAAAIRDTIKSLDTNPVSGFPRKQPLWGNRRYWPAVAAYLEHVYGFKVPGRAVEKPWRAA